MDRRALIGTMAALLYGSACAGRTDRTAATVDVTGLWEGSALAAAVADHVFSFKQTTRPSPER